MSHIGRFEELIAWQKARGLTKTVYEITRTAEFAKDFGLASQIQRAAVSIMSKITGCALLSKNNVNDYNYFSIFLLRIPRTSYLRDYVP